MIDISYAVLFLTLIVILGLALFFFTGYLNRQSAKIFELLKENQDIVVAKLDKDRKRDSEKIRLNVTMQAYERMVLFMERINPSNMISRVISPGLKVGAFRAMLINSIREEYEHNMTQQLFISDVAWDKVKTAKEEVTLLITNAASKLNQEAPAAELAKEILTSGFTSKNHPVQSALRTLKHEMLKNFN